MFDFRFFFDVIFEVHFGRRTNRESCENQFCSTSWGRPGGMCVARGRDREGVIRRSRPRLLKLSILGLIDIWPKTLIWNLARGATCGGAAELALF